MKTKKLPAQNYTRATLQKICPASPPDSKYFRANKPEVSLPASDTKFPKFKCKIPKY